MIKFSVIIPFKKESNYLKKNLNALNQIKDNNLFEVILLPDEDFEIFEQYNFTFSIIPTGKISPPRKRDIGVKNSVSQYIYFIDDDAYIKDNIFNKALDLFLKNTEYECIAGPAITPEEEDNFAHISDIFFCSRLGGGFPERYRQNHSIKYQVDDWPSVNFFITRKAYNVINGFNTDIWPGEDSYFCSKLLKNKIKILYSGDLSIFHFRRTNWKKHLNQISNYGFQRGFLIKNKINNSMNIKYFIPSFFLIATIISFLNIFFQNYILLIFNFITIIYFSSIFFISILNKRNSILVISLFFSSHIIYGIKFILGFFSKQSIFLKKI